MSNSQTWHGARLVARQPLAARIHQFEIEPDEPAEFPFDLLSAGAHIDVALPYGGVRQYSLMDPQVHAPDGARPRLRIGIQRDAQGRGGSMVLCDNLQPGISLRISAPRNNFALHADDAPTVLIAGGIGITPIWSMVQALQQSGRPWQLHYAARSRAEAALLSQLEVLPQVQLHFDDEAEGRWLDIEAIVRHAPADAHLYCCGPAPMLDAFETAAADWPEARRHIERFSADTAPALAEAPCVIHLARSQRELQLEPGQSILDLLRDAGLDVAYSCEQGICGSCETPVLEGEVDHRDSILSPSEQAANKTMMICCSLPKGERLVLDL